MSFHMRFNLSTMSVRLGAIFVHTLLAACDRVVRFLSLNRIFAPAHTHTRALALLPDLSACMNRGQTKSGHSWLPIMTRVVPILSAFELHWASYLGVCAVLWPGICHSSTPACYFGVLLLAGSCSRNQMAHRLLIRESCASRVANHTRRTRCGVQHINTNSASMERVLSPTRIALARPHWASRP